MGAVGRRPRRWLRWAVTSVAAGLAAATSAAEWGAAVAGGPFGNGQMVGHGGGFTSRNSGLHVRGGRGFRRGFGFGGGDWGYDCNDWPYDYYGYNGYYGYSCY